MKNDRPGAATPKAVGKGKENKMDHIESVDVMIGELNISRYEDLFEGYGGFYAAANEECHRFWSEIGDKPTYYKGEHYFGFSIYKTQKNGSHRHVGWAFICFKPGSPIVLRMNPASKFSGPYGGRDAFEFVRECSRVLEEKYTILKKYELLK